MEAVSLLKTVLEELTQISAELKDLSHIKVIRLNRPYLSPEVKDIYSSLAKAQAEIALADRDSENPYFKSKYANLASFIQASRPALTKNGLSLSHRIEINVCRHRTQGLPALNQHALEPALPERAMPPGRPVVDQCHPQLQLLHEHREIE